jgi:hypothetical protein
MNINLFILYLLNDKITFADVNYVLLFTLNNKVKFSLLIELYDIILYNNK